MSLELPVESKQCDPLIVVVTLPDEGSVQANRDSLRLHIVVEAEVSFVERLAPWAKAQQRR